MRFRDHLARKTGGSLIITQSDREYAENNYQRYGAVLGVNHQGPIRTTDNKIPHLHRPVADEDTPSQEDISAWVDFGVGALNGGRNLLLHCEAGQNRSVIISSLVEALFDKRNWWDIVEMYHDEMLKEDPPANWWPYDHWEKAISEWLLKLVVRPPTSPIVPPSFSPISMEEAIQMAGASRPDFLGSLYTYAVKLPDNSLIVEIGTNQAQSTIAMACAIRGTNSRIITIDPVFRTGEVWVRDAHWKGSGCYESNIRDVLNKITAAGLDGIVSIVPDYSFNVLTRWDGRMIDLLHVDGAHTYNDVLRDCDWMQFVKPGRWAAFDDWIAPVERAVIEYVSGHPEWQLLHKSTDSPDGDMVVTLLQKIS